MLDASVLLLCLQTHCKVSSRFFFLYPTSPQHSRFLFNVSFGALKRSAHVFISRLLRECVSEFFKGMMRLQGSRSHKIFEHFENNFSLNHKKSVSTRVPTTEPSGAATRQRNNRKKKAKRQPVSLDWDFLSRVIVSRSILSTKSFSFRFFFSSELSWANHEIWIRASRTCESCWPIVLQNTRKERRS